MAMLPYLAVAAIICTAFYLTKRRHWRRRHGFLDDAEKSVAMLQPSRLPNKTSFLGDTPAKWTTADTKIHLQADQQAASAQLLDEIAAVSNTTSEIGKADPRCASNVPTAVERSALEGQVIFVNPKQYHRILKRRISRQAWAEALRSKKAQGRTLRRSRVAHVDGVIVGVS